MSLSPGLISISAFPLSLSFLSDVVRVRGDGCGVVCELGTSKYFRDLWGVPVVFFGLGEILADRVDIEGDFPPPPPTLGLAGASFVASRITPPLVDGRLLGGNGLSATPPATADFELLLVDDLRRGVCAVFRRGDGWAGLAAIRTAGKSLDLDVVITEFRPRRFRGDGGGSESADEPDEEEDSDAGIFWLVAGGTCLRRGAGRHMVVSGDRRRSASRSSFHPPVYSVLVDGKIY